MRPTPHKIYRSTALLFLGAIPLHALTTTEIRTSATLPISVVSARNNGDSRSVLDSLRQDVAQHPADYITFETETAARRFLLDHLTALRETDRVMISRGVLGYWQGKIVVVVPSLATRNLSGYPR